MLATVWIGFYKSYFGAGMVTAKLPTTLVHVHAVVFTLWMILLTVQIGLVSARKVRIHMQLGLWGFGLAGLMIALGLSTAIQSMKRGMVPPGFPPDPRVFFVIPFSDVVIFTLFVALGYALRRKAAAHKRAILIANIMIMDAPLGRVGIAHGIPVATAVWASMLVIMMIYDGFTLRKIHWMTLLGTAVIVGAVAVRIPLAQMHPWLAFADMLKN